MEEFIQRGWTKKPLQVGDSWGETKEQEGASGMCVGGRQSPAGGLEVLRNRREVSKRTKERWKVSLEK